MAETRIEGADLDGLIAMLKGWRKKHGPGVVAFGEKGGEKWLNPDMVKVSHRDGFIGMSETVMGKYSVDNPHSIAVGKVG